MEPLTILFQDEFLVAIDKPAGMIVHTGREPEPPENIAMKRLRDQLGQRVFPVHRLDRPTSGVLLFALDKQTAAISQQTFEQRNIVKTYYAIVCGTPTEKWICTTPLSSHPDDKPLAATTSFNRLDVATVPNDPPLTLSLIQATPETGRFHQIRRHLLEIDFPIVGDFKYAGMERSFELCGILNIGTRMLLQSGALQFTHPRSGIPLKIEAPPDPDFEKCFPKFRKIVGRRF